MVCRDGSVKLLDFGVAKVVDAFDYDTSMTVQGKFPYMSPEQVNRLPVDRRADVFAAGIVVHEMLAGRRLFAAATELETLRRVDACEVAPPSVYNAHVSVGLDAVVLKALSRDPSDRFDSGDEMAAALMQVERVSAGRQRVAEFLAKLFPSTFAAVCEVCGKQAPPGFACGECSNVIPPEAPSTQNVRLQDLERILSDEELEPEIIASEPAGPLLAVEPYPLQTVVDPRRPRPKLKRVLAIAGSVGVIAGVALLRMYTPATSRRAPAATSRTAPRRDESQPIRVVPIAVPTVCPPTASPPAAAAAAAVEAGPVKLRDDVPTQPLPMIRSSKVARVAIKKAPAGVARHTQPARPAETPARHSDVRQGALLDPFGQDD